MTFKIYASVQRIIQYYEGIVAKHMIRFRYFIYCTSEKDSLIFFFFLFNGVISELILENINII